MEENQSSLFGMGIDPASKIHLSEAAKWARFLAILGFIICGLIVCIGIFASSFMALFASRYSDGVGPGYGSGFAIGITILYLIIALIYFFPCLYLFRFSTHMKRALGSNDQNTLTSSFQNLKIMFRYVGILTIIVIAFYAIFFLFWVVTAASMR